MSYMNVFLKHFCRLMNVQVFKNQFSLLNKVTALSVKNFQLWGASWYACGVCLPHTSLVYSE